MKSSYSELDLDEQNSLSSNALSWVFALAFLGSWLVSPNVVEVGLSVLKKLLLHG